MRDFLDKNKGWIQFGALLALYLFGPRIGIPPGLIPLPTPPAATVQVYSGVVPHVEVVK